MADYGATYTDKTITELDKEIQAVYKEAEKDIQKKMDDFNAKYKIKEQKYQQKVDSGQMTQEEFDRWKKGQVFQGQQWQAKKDQILDTMHHSNEIATKIINGQSQNIFMVNANYMSYDIEHGAGVNFGFGLYDQNTVANLIANDPKLLPEWKINEKKDYIWSQKKLNNAITQGIIQGESLDKISKRISDKLASTNENKMKTFARTAMTGAQNSGRQMQLENAKKLDINLQKEWMATLDGRTRDSHRDMDGEKVKTNEKFSNGLRYPGDPDGSPAETYNCRCTMVGDVVDYPSTYDRYDNIDGKKIKNMSYNEWEEAKKKGDDISPVPLSFKHFKTSEQQSLMDLFGSKSMSGLYNDIKGYDKALGNQFYKELGTAGKPSEVWSKYVDGTLDSKTSAEIDTILKQYGQGTGKIVPPVDLKTTFADKKMSSVYNDMKNVDTKMANQFYKDLKDMGKPSEVWGKYLNGELSPSEVKKIEGSLGKYLKAEANKTTTVKNANEILKEVKPKEIKTLEDAQDALKSAEEAVKKAGADKQFIGIWKDPVTYADYEAKAGSIAAKKKYYEEQIAKYSGSAYANSSWVPDEIKKLQDNFKQLEEFEKNGKAYSELLKNVEDAKSKVKSFTPINITGRGFDSKLYDPKVKAASKSFTSGSTADKYHRPLLDDLWKTSKDDEKYAVWEYTRNSNPMNKSLSGYHDGWSRSDFIGLDKTVWGHEDSWRSIPSNFSKFGTDGHANYKKTITDLTKFIDRSEMQDNVNLVRGSDKSGLAGLLEGNLFSFDDAKQLLNKDEKTLKAALEGQIFQNHSFMSTGIAKGTGFSGEVSYEIYAPKGTRGIYAEPQSYFGNTISGAELYTTGKKYSSVGGEAEVILQRGTEFRISEITKSGNRINVKMEVIGQPDYFKYGDEDTFNAGKTRHAK